MGLLTLYSEVNQDQKHSQTSAVWTLAALPPSLSLHWETTRRNKTAFPNAEREGIKDTDRILYTLTPTPSAGEVCSTVQFSKQVSASRSYAGWLTVCSHRAEWPEHFMCKPALLWLLSDVMKRSWQAESSHSRCSPTLPGPGANAPTQMPAHATGRGDKTHQVTLPFRMVPTLSCHRCEMPSRQTLTVTESDRQLSMVGRVQRTRLTGR